MSASSSDPVAALGDALRSARLALRCFSSVRGREVTGTHLLRIGAYSTVGSLLARGKCVESEPFRAGGHRWRLSYYPNGVAILDGDGNAVCSSAASRSEYSARSGGIWIDVEEAKADALRSLKDDSLSVRCDVTVQSMEKESRVKCLLRAWLQQ
ncbi:BTB/POZ and MATH domain-containing protein 2-like [Panicum miliaceum]|uniref:BTB/POZ and MATH domain-containing protein 2-like n=1 Tax=Panicum miliaceum TaxID=4540 RepID=A0A3L6SRV7_PANMI|nr:BTB/POZ and MATH domain-containing protein 2-like [Panicum miliaceum]